MLFGTESLQKPAMILVVFVSLSHSFQVEAVTTDSSLHVGWLRRPLAQWMVNFFGSDGSRITPAILACRTRYLSIPSFSCFTLTVPARWHFGKDWVKSELGKWRSPFLLGSPSWNVGRDHSWHACPHLERLYLCWQPVLTNFFCFFNAFWQGGPFLTRVTILQLLMKSEGESIQLLCVDHTPTMNFNWSVMTRPCHFWQTRHQLCCWTASRPTGSVTGRGVGVKGVVGVVRVLVILRYLINVSKRAPCEAVCLPATSWRAVQDVKLSKILKLHPVLIYLGLSVHVFQPALEHWAINSLSGTSMSAISSGLGSLCNANALSEANVSGSCNRQEHTLLHQAPLKHCLALKTNLRGVSVAQQSAIRQMRWNCYIPTRKQKSTQNRDCKQAFAMQKPYVQTTCTQKPLLSNKTYRQKHP